jgi:ABC-type uncharacterized transport system YnjBCD ATPase subunit
MPLAYYLGVIAVAFSQTIDHPRFLMGVGVLASLAGAFVMWAMAGWLESSHQTVGHINAVERDLGLIPTAQRRPLLHAVPHFLLVGIGIVASLILALQCIPCA